MKVIAVHTLIEERRYEMGRRLDRPIRRVITAAVLENPFAGSYVDDLSELIEASVSIGREISETAVAALADAVESYGKGVIVGTNGELEHAAALLHPKLGVPLRAACGGGLAIIPSAKKRGGPGTTLDIPLHYKDAAFVRSHFDAVELRIAESPTADQLVLAVAVSNGGRPLPRVGGLTIEDAERKDGLR